jgi:hypothetical protein
MQCTDIRLVFSLLRLDRRLPPESGIGIWKQKNKKFRCKDLDDARIAHTVISAAKVPHYNIHLDEDSKTIRFISSKKNERNFNAASLKTWKINIRIFLKGLSEGWLETPREHYCDKIEDQTKAIELENVVNDKGSSVLKLSARRKKLPVCIVRPQESYFKYFNRYVRVIGTEESLNELFTAVHSLNLRDKV